MSKFYEVPANYMKLLPEVFQGIKEFELLAEIINPYLDELNAILKRYTDNSLIPFIFTIAAQPKSQTLHHFMK